MSAQENENEPSARSANLEVMQNAVQQITDGILESAHLGSGDSVTVKVAPQEHAWVAEQAIISKLKFHNLFVFFHRDSSAKTHYLLDVRSIALQVRYDHMFRDGLFGTKRVERQISAQLSCQLENKSSNEILYSGSPSKMLSDTVAVDDIEKLEHTGVNVTHGELPSENFLDRIVEPFVIIGATGVAVYLLFHIRS